MERRRIAYTVCMGLALMFVSNAALAQYQLTNLDSNQVGTAKHTDPLIVNAWGLVHAPGSPWWVSDNDSGWSTLYDGAGNIEGLRVLVPTAKNGPDSPAGDNGPGTPTGIVYNGSQEFQVQGWPSSFLFATLDGTISGWAFQSNPNQAIVAVDTSTNKNPSVYTGLAITNKPSENRLYAADLANNKVDIYDGNFNLVKSFTDTTLPDGFAPFGIRDINGLVYVTFASVSGASGGFVDVFKEDGSPVTPGEHLFQGAPLNQPWGIAAAPGNFGPLSNTLLISNNTNNGTINAFDVVTKKVVGTIKDINGKTIVIDQLWGIDFGDGTKGGQNGRANQMFFTAGPFNNLAGTFGVIAFKP
ncbi:MAG: TIGR03118 family protein [Candidatus Sulfotelmatobacter sp.]